MARWGFAARSLGELQRLTSQTVQITSLSV